MGVTAAEMVTISCSVLAARRYIVQTCGFAKMSETVTVRSRLTSSQKALLYMEHSPCNIPIYGKISSDDFSKRTVSLALTADPIVNGRCPPFLRDSSTANHSLYAPNADHISATMRLTNAFRTKENDKFDESDVASQCPADYSSSSQVLTYK